MNFSEFIRRLGSEPGSRDPEFLRARESAPEFIRAAQESDRFEGRLRRALDVSPPGDLLPRLQELVQRQPLRRESWKTYAMAASLVLAVAAGVFAWRLNNPHFDSVDQYVAYHYGHDGAKLLVKAEGRSADNISEILDRFQVKMTPELSRMVGFIKYCPTPDGRGAHFVLNTPTGPITVIFMPDTPVINGERLEFGGMQAELVALASGSAAVIGQASQDIGEFSTMVQRSIVPISSEA